jgi:Txe/YoeB family toxin of Txe-Axe toxin-antitoxin module
MKLTVKKIPKKVLKQIKYIRGDGYKIIYKNKNLSSETYYSRVGAAAMIMGFWEILE